MVLGVRKTRRVSHRLQENKVTKATPLSANRSGAATCLYFTEILTYSCLQRSCQRARLLVWGKRAKNEEGRMPVFLCRWQNGDTAFAYGAEKADAVGLIDLELDYPEDWQLTKVDEFLLDVQITDEGEFEIDFIGERLTSALDRAYPILTAAKARIAESGSGLTAEEAKRIITEAVASERVRLENAVSPNADKTESTYRRMMKRTYGIPTRGDTR
jgi:hypothetical protein